MMLFVGLNDVAIQSGGLQVALRLAKADEFRVANDRERLARELGRRDALDRRREREKVSEHGRARTRVEAGAVDAEIAETLLDEPVMLRLVASLPRQRELDVNLGGRRNETRGTFGGLELVLERKAKEPRDRHVRRRLAGRGGTDALERRAVLRVELRNEIGDGHHGLAPRLGRLGADGSTCRPPWSLRGAHPRDKPAGSVDAPTVKPPSPSSSPALLDAGRALARGEPLTALGLVGRVESALGLTLRGVAYAQLGDLDLARQSLTQAVALAEDTRTRARARAALVEIALSTGDPAPAARAAKASAEELAALGDTRNAAMQRLVQARAEVLLGRLGEARGIVQEVLSLDLAPDVRAVASLAQAEIAIRALAATEARDALARARHALEDAPHPLLTRALAALEQELSLPVARTLRGGVLQSADFFAIEEASGGEVLLVDACRRVTIAGRVTIPLARRPVLFALLLVLARAWPDSVPRDELAAKAFDARKVNASHRSRLRVEIGRLRKVLDGLAAEPVATAGGYALSSKREVVVLLPPSDDEAARVALLLGDGASWSARGLAEHAGVSRRTVQRALGALVENGRATRLGSGKDVRYARMGTPVASRMLLLGLVPKA